MSDPDQPSQPPPPWRRAAGRVVGPVRDPLWRRFDEIETRLDRLEQMITEVRDRVEADLSSIVELTLELQRTLAHLADDDHTE